MGILVTAALLLVFACDNNKKPAQDNKVANKQEDVVEKSVVKSLENEEAVTKQAAPDSMAMKQQSVPADEQVFIVVEEQASFQGGSVDQFRTWVTKNLKYPDIAVKKGISGKAVSYTHLRAHETRHDLVCRLL